MSKYVVRTKGKYMLIDPISGQEVRHEGYTMVTMTNFLQSRIAAGQVSVESPEFPDDATDEEFRGYLKDSEGNIDLAISSYLSKFQSVEMQESSPAESDGEPDREEGGEPNSEEDENPNSEGEGEGDSERSTESRRRHRGRSRR